MKDSIIILCANYLFIVPVLTVLWVCLTAIPQQRGLLLLRGCIITALCVALAEVAEGVYYECRPFVTHHFRPLVAHVADNGFPSDHALLTFACTFFLLPCSLRLALAVGLSRRWLALPALPVAYIRRWTSSRSHLCCSGKRHRCYGSEATAFLHQAGEIGEVTRCVF